MSPRLVLSLWRERWGDNTASDSELPYLRGWPNRWGVNLTHAKAWSWPGVTALALLGCVVVYLMLMTAHFSQGGQVAFSVLFVGIALYVRRYAGTLVTLMLFGMAVIAATRYLYWRLTETLGHGFNVEFLWGLGLWAAELYFWLLLALRIVQTLWPITRRAVPLPIDVAAWPTVDIFIKAHGKTDASIEQAALSALALEWPKSKIKTYLLDDEPQDSLRALAESMGIGYVVPDISLDSSSELINFALSQTKGDLILMLDGSESPDRGLLKIIAGWFVGDAHLGMLQTPHHFLTPLPSEDSLALCHAPTLPGHVAFALIRRSFLAATGGVALDAVSSHSHTALQLQARGYGHGYIGYTNVAHDQASDLEKVDSFLGQNESPSLALFRVDAPFLGRTLRLKRLLAGLHSVLQFYYIVPRFIFYTAPLAYLLAGIHLFQTTPELLFAYGFPYLILAHFTQVRLRGESRLSTWVDMRESLLAWYLLIPTTLTLFRTELSRSLGKFKVDTQSPFDRWVVGFYGCVAVLNLAGLGVGLVRLVFLQDAAFEVTGLYLIWCISNLMLFAALLAVSEETRHVRRQKRLLLEMPAMLQVSSGRTLACVTQNFPQQELALTLPVALANDVGSSINLSIFRGHDEFNFPARVVSQNDGRLTLRIEDSFKDKYQLFGAAVLSRGPDWPLWLPARDADHPLPSWVTRPFIAGWTKLRAATRILDKFLKWSRLGHWIGK